MNLADATDARFTAAPAPSPAEAATIARFGIFEAEERVEQVARAIFEADAHTHGGLTWDSDDFTDWGRDVYRRLAAAAIAALTPSPAEEVVVPSCACGGPCDHDGSLAAAVAAELAEKYRVARDEYQTFYIDREDFDALIAALTPQAGEAGQ